MQTTKIKNIILKVVDVERGFADDGRPFENLVCKDEQGRFFNIGLDESNYNYKRYKENDLFLVKSARCFQASATLFFLYYVRIKH